MNAKPGIPEHFENGETPMEGTPIEYESLPHFWRFEQSGVLAPAVERFLRNQTQLKDISIIRAYLKQWIDSPAWDENIGHDVETRAELAQLRRTAGAIITIQNIRMWLAMALDIGIDPL